MFIHFLRGKTISQVNQRLRLRSRFAVVTNAMATGIYANSPVYYAQTSDGQLFMANGIDPMMKWDGFAAAFTTVGVPAPTDSMHIAVSGLGSITGSYVSYQRFLDDKGNPSNLSPISNTIVASGNSTVTYTGVPVPTDEKIARRQIIRNTAGQTSTFFVDVDSDDLGATTFSSTKTDDDLETQEQVSLFDPATGESIADIFGLPPDNKPFIAHNNDRMFAAGHVVYREGHCEVTTGSATVTGIGTTWKSTFVNRRFVVTGARAAYKITGVDEDAQTLTLDSAWQEATSYFASYSIAPYPAERRLVYYTPAGYPDAWPASNAIAVQEDNDEITGLMSLKSFVYLLEREHVYRFTFKDDPALDGAFFPAVSRGCLNPRCYCVAEETAYVMDRKGIYSFNGGNAADPVSAMVQDLFRVERDDLRINWEAERSFHAAHFPSQETVRFFVCLSGERAPRHCLCYSYRQGGWWLEEWPFAVTASCVAYMDVQRTLVGSDRATVLALEVGPLDIARVGDGTTRGAATSATVDSISDSTAAFADNLEGAPVAIVSGRGKDQVRLIASVDGTRINVTQPWLTIPSVDGDDQSTYQIGAIEWQWISGWHRYLPEESDNARAVELYFEPMNVPCTLDIRLFEDNNTAATKFGVDYHGDAVSYQRGTTDVRVDLEIMAEATQGYGLLRCDGGQELWNRSPNLLTIELHGFSAEETPILYHVSVKGVTEGA